MRNNVVAQVVQTLNPRQVQCGYIYRKLASVKSVALYNTIQYSKRSIFCGAVGFPSSAKQQHCSIEDVLHPGIYLPQVTASL